MANKGTIYILGICGTFMGGLAKLAKSLGYTVCGSDANVYPPMSTQLESLGVTLIDGFDANNVLKVLEEANEQNATFIVGNSISRGNPELEIILERHLPFTSGAQWLAENVLQGQWVLGVAGTHGKTTTASILTWILHYNQLHPSFLIGGVCENFDTSACINPQSPFFVIEADEYDTAFSDKRSKFIHYRPSTLIINNLEFDHADIFADLTAIQTQFHHLLKTVPKHGLIIHNQNAPAIDATLAMGCWSETTGFGAAKSDWQVSEIPGETNTFTLTHQQTNYTVQSPLLGEHNRLNTLAAIAAAHHVGVPIQNAIDALPSFKSVKRRLEVLHQSDDIIVYDDFAHHPTAIKETLKAIKLSHPNDGLIAILEPRSNTMKQGVHKHHLRPALEDADYTFIYADANMQWDVSALSGGNIKVYDNIEKIVLACTQIPKLHQHPKYHIVIMSNGGFEGIHQKIIAALSR